MGSPLKPDALATLEKIATQGGPPEWMMPIEEVRSRDEAEAAAEFGQDEIGAIEDFSIEGEPALPLRIFTPDGELGSHVIVYFHGGGFATGSLDICDGMMRRLANHTQHIVIGVGYRLAPEYPYPAALEDAERAFEWAVRTYPQRRPVIAGDSAGGNIATVAAKRATRRGTRPAAQVLLYPMTDSDLNTPTFQEFAGGYGLSREHMAWFWSMYAPGDHEPIEPDMAPVRETVAPDSPPAILITAEYDVLRDEAERYGGMLIAAGVPLIHYRFAGQIHGFIGNRRSPDEATAFTLIADGLALLATAEDTAAERHKG